MVFVFKVGALLNRVIFKQELVLSVPTQNSCSKTQKREPEEWAQRPERAENLCLSLEGPFRHRPTALLATKSGTVLKLEIIGLAKSCGQRSPCTSKSNSWQKGLFSSRLDRINRERNAHTYTDTHRYTHSKDYRGVWTESKRGWGQVFILFFEMICIVLIPITISITCLLYKASL